MASINLNVMATVTLTQLGASIYNTWIRKDGGWLIPEDKAAGDTLKMPLWELFQAFGASLYHGMVGVPFENNNIQLEDA